METAAVVLPVFEPTDIITPDELCARLKVGRTWIYEKMRQRRRAKHPIPVIKLGSHLRFSWKAISAWLHAQEPPVKKAARG
jgi:excisionase family DNA binding protein